jgi:phage terminase small subunit
VTAKKLTPKQEMFCLEYLIDLNATQAAIRAEYSEATAKAQGCRLLTNVYVQERIQEAFAERSSAVKVDANYVLQKLHEIAEMDVLDILNNDMSFRSISDWPKVWRQYISSFDMAEMFEVKDDQKEMVGILKKIKWPDKVKNLELLGKHTSVKAFGSDAQEKETDQERYLSAIENIVDKLSGA